MKVAEAKKLLCAKYGFEGVFPLDTELELSGLSPEQQAEKIFTANTELMDSCDLIVADMTPYRGESMDVGTAFEMGYMSAQGKPVYGYSNVSDNFAVRSAKLLKLSERLSEPGVFEDEDGMRIESFGELSENLMCACCLTEPVVHLAQDVAESLSGSESFEYLEAFEECLGSI